MLTAFALLWELWVKSCKVNVVTATFSELKKCKQTSKSFTDTLMMCVAWKSCWPKVIATQEKCQIFHSGPQVTQTAASFFHFLMCVVRSRTAPARMCRTRACVLSFLPFVVWHPLSPKLAVLGTDVWQRRTVEYKKIKKGDSDKETKR